jgi:GT2 family glycosyltransferase
VNVPVSIVIPVHNGRELLEKLLTSIAGQSATPLEVIVVDDGSADGAAGYALSAGARVIAMGGNCGFAAAVNRGIQEAKGESIALINSDVELDSRWLETLWGSGRAADFATGKILQTGSDHILDGSYDLICRGGCSWRAGAGRPAATVPDVVSSIRFCSATAALFKAELFRKAGLFEELFESYLEDVDFGLRCIAAERKGTYSPGAICWHQGSATLGRWNARVVRLISRNQVFLIARHYPAKLIRRWFWHIVVAHVLWGALAVRHGCGGAWIRGKVEGLRRFRAVRTAAGSPSGNLAPAIVDSEREIYRLQSELGFDAYWQLYFRLTGSPR